MTSTKHTHRPNFGRKVAGCLRCMELDAGDAPRSWSRTEPYATPAQRRNRPVTNPEFVQMGLV